MSLPCTDNDSRNNSLSSPFFLLGCSKNLSPVKRLLMENVTWWAVNAMTRQEMNSDRGDTDALERGLTQSYRTQVILFLLTKYWKRPHPHSYVTTIITDCFEMRQKAHDVDCRSCGLKEFWWHLGNCINVWRFVYFRFMNDNITLVVDIHS